MGQTLSPAEDSLLRQLYSDYGIPSDQYARRPADLSRFISEWNALSERHDVAEDIMHYIKTKRKKGRWVTFGGAHQRLGSLPESVLTPEQWTELGAVYDELCASRGVGSDNLDYDDSLAARFSLAFAQRTGLLRDGRWLLALIMGRRKRGTWQTFRHEDHDEGNLGFGDIDEIAS